MAPRVKLEEAITHLFEDGIADASKLAEIGQLGAQLIIQKGVEDEVTAFLGTS